MIFNCVSRLTLGLLIGFGGLPALKVEAQEVDSDLFAKRVFQSADGETLPYRLASPPRSDSAEGNKYPLVLFLHGAGERGDDNEAQLKHGIKQFATPERRRDFPAFLVAPQCPTDSQWVKTPWELEQGEGTFPKQPSRPMSLVFELIQQLCEQFPVDTDRLYVTGLSMGGYGSWYAAGYAQYAKANPDLASDSIPVISFAAMLAVCGGGDPLWANCYESIPLWAIHGNADPVVPVGRSREMIQVITREGHPGELRYTELAGVAHDSWTQSYAREDVYRWLFAQIRTKNPAH